MKIYGIKLSKNPWMHVDDAPKQYEYTVNPEEDFCEACHMYEDTNGNHYLGFELSLELNQTIMEELLLQKGKIYKVT